MCQISESPLSIQKEDSDNSIFLSKMSIPMPRLHSYLHEIKQQAITAFPATAGLLLYKIPWIISLHFVGSIGAEELAAAALATTLCNVTGMSFSVGLSFAITTLAGQARGDLLRKGQMMRNNQNKNKHRVNGTNGGQLNDCGDTEGTCSSSSNNDEKIVEESYTPLLNSDEEEQCATQSYGATITDQNPSPMETTKSESESDDSNKDDVLPLPPLQPLVFLYRAIAIQLAFVIPIGLWWIYGIQPVLLRLGQAEQISKMTELYLRILTPGLWAYSINWTITSFLQSIEMSNVPAWAAFVGFLTHIPFNILFVNIFGWGYEGVAMATVMFQLLQPLIICIYLFGTKHGRERLLERSGAKAIGRDHLSFWPELTSAVSSISGIKQYLMLALPGIVMISEWWASECAIFLAGNLSPDPDYSLGAMSIYQTINTFFFMFPMGFGIASSSRVGMFLGMNNPNAARLSSTVGTWMAGLASGTMGLIIYCTPHTLFPSLFSMDRHLVDLASELMPMLALYVFADGVQSALSGVVKGCGRQSMVMPIVLVAYWVVGLPLAYYNSFQKYEGTTECGSGFSTCGVQGLVFGMTTGTWTHFLLLAFAFSVAIDWTEEAGKAQRRVTH